MLRYVTFVLEEKIIPYTKFSSAYKTIPSIVILLFTTTHGSIFVYILQYFKRNRTIRGKKVSDEEQLNSNEYKMQYHTTSVVWIKLHQLLKVLCDISTTLFLDS